LAFMAACLIPQPRGSSTSMRQSEVSRDKPETTASAKGGSTARDLSRLSTPLGPTTAGMPSRRAPKLTFRQIWWRWLRESDPTLIGPAIAATSGSPSQASALHS
jgi:hypothetical protein